MKKLTYKKPQIREKRIKLNMFIRKSIYPEMFLASCQISIGQLCSVSCGTCSQ
jgi:hypothetical protein